MQGRIRNQALSVDIESECAHCARPLHLTADSELRLRVPMMPSMLTRNEVVIRQDCLCYFMERLTLEAVPGYKSATPLENSA